MIGLVWGKERTILLASAAALWVFYGVLIYTVCDFFSWVDGYDRCVAPDVFELALFAIFAAAPVLFLPKKVVPISILLWLIYLMNVLGSIILLPIIQVNVSFALKVLFAAIILVSFYLLCLMARIEVKQINLFNVAPRLYITILLIFNASVTLYIINANGYSFELASIYDVYKVRQDFKDAVAEQGGRAVVYAMLIGGYSLAPLTLLVGFYFLRRYPFASIFLLISSAMLSLSIYSAAAYKSVVFAPLLSLLFYFGLRKGGSVNNFLRLWVLIFFAAYLLYFFDFNVNVFVHWIRRVFFVPGLNSIYYLEYFGMTSFGYGQEAPLLISQEYFGENGNANAGLYGNGIAVAGVFGIFRNILVIGMYIFAFKSLAPRGADRLVVAAIVPFAYALSNSATTASLVSYGGFFTLLLLFLGRRAISGNSALQKK